MDKEKLKKRAMGVAIAGLHGYRASLKAKIIMTDTALLNIQRMERRYEKPLLISSKAQEKGEEKDMKNVIALVAALAAAGATLAGAAYYLYKKNRENEEYDDILYDDARLDENNYINYEDTIAEEDVAKVATGVVDEVKGAAKDIADSVGELIDNVRDKIEENKK